MGGVKPQMIQEGKTEFAERLGTSDELNGVSQDGSVFQGQCRFMSVTDNKQPGGLGVTKPLLLEFLAYIQLGFVLVS